MKDQFNNTSFASKDQERAILRDEAENNRKTDEVQKKRLVDRKQKELEAKLFLDKQIAEKDYLKQQFLVQKQADADHLQKLTEDYTIEQEKKREERRVKNLMHVEQVKEQMKEVPRTFAKTGIAIIK